MSAPYPRLPDINILPLEHRPRRLTPLEGGLAVLALMGILLLPWSLQPYLDARSDISTLRSEHQRLLAAADALAPQIQAGEKLRQEIAALEARGQAQSKVREFLQGRRLEWDRLLSNLLVALPAGVELTSVAKGVNDITVEGISRLGFDGVAQYYNQLKATPGVSRVTVTRTAAVGGPGAGGGLSFTLSVELVTA